MKKIYSLVLFLIFVSFSAQKKNQDYSFYENKGQIVDQNGNPNSEVKYLLNSAGLNVQIKENGFSYDVYEVETKEIKKKNFKENKILNQRKNSSDKEINYKYHRIDIDFVDSKNNPEIVAEGKSNDYENYYNLDYKKEGVSFVHRYKKITYKNLYDKIDLVFFKPVDSTKPVEYNFLVHPGGRISDIKMKFNGAKTQLKNGKLAMKLRFGEMQENIPNSWIENDSKQNITVNYKNLENQTFGFESSINTSDQTIVIDPVPTRIWQTHHVNGTHAFPATLKVLTNEYGFLYTMDNRLAIYVASSGQYLNESMNAQVYGYLAKFDQEGNKLMGIYMGNHQYANDNSNSFEDFTIDKNNNLYIVGKAKDNLSKRNTITTPGAHKTNSGHYDSSGYYWNYHDGFIMKFDGDGNKVWGTYYGGDMYETIQAVITDSNNDIIISGYTGSSNGIISSNAIFKTETTSFISKFSKDGKMLYGSYYNLNSTYETRGIEALAIDSNDNLYIAGNGSSVTNFNSPHQNSIIGGTNVFFGKLDKNFNNLWMSYFGGRNYWGTQYNSNQGFTLIKAIKIDNDDNLILAGDTEAIENIATPSSFQPTYNHNIGNNIFLTKFSPNGTQIWGTYFGANSKAAVNDDLVFGLDVNKKNDIIFGGFTANDNNIATPDGLYPTQMSGGYNSGFITKFNTNGNRIWGTYVKSPPFSLHLKENDIFTYDSTYLSKYYDCKSALQVQSNSPICIGANIELSASGGTSYTWSGPNGFTSKDQNPKILNATIANNGVYTCIITGSGGCDGTLTVNVLVGDKTKPIPDLATLPKITGDCKTIISTIPTATDNCKGQITATTSDLLSYSLPGNYTITWKYDDGNDNVETQTQQVEITSQPLPVANPNQTFCKINQPRISDITVTATNPKWYDASGAIITNLSALLTDNTKYYVTQNASGCESAKKEILVTLSDPSAPTGNAIQDFCSATNPTLKNIIVAGTDIKWYNNLGNSISDTTPLVDGATYYASQIVNSCESTQKLAIKVNVITNYLSANNFADSFCNDITANFKTINLDDYKKELITNPQDYIFEFKNSAGQLVSGNVDLTIGNNIFDVKITSSLGCYQDVKLDLTLNPKPEINLPKEAEYCDDTLGVILNPGYDPNFTYSWDSGETTQTINANQEKTYTVTVTNQFGCDNTASVVVKKAKLATIQNIIITNNNALVVMSTAGDYLYSLNQINWQSSNKFENLPNGNYTVYVKTNLNCNLGSKTFTIFSLSNIFSPNSDGINDTWKISGIENYPNSEIKIIDKNGIMVVNEITKGEPFEWNGESNGRKLPTDSYWYQIKLSDGRILQGYVVIKSRN